MPHVRSLQEVQSSCNIVTQLFFELVARVGQDLFLVGVGEAPGARDAAAFVDGPAVLDRQAVDRSSHGLARLDVGPALCLVNVTLRCALAC